MIFFKKKLSEAEAPVVLSEIVRVILENSALDPNQVVRKLGLPLPPIPKVLTPAQFAGILADIIAKTIPEETALEIIKEIKNQLKDYKV